MNKKIFKGMIVVGLVAAVFFTSLSSTATPHKREDYLRLIYNTDQCFADCYAIIEVTNPTPEDFTLDNNNWKTWYIKGEGAEGLVDGLRFQILQNVEYEVSVPDYQDTSKSIKCDKAENNPSSQQGRCYLKQTNKSKNNEPEEDMMLLWEGNYNRFDPETNTFHYTLKEKKGSHKEKRTKKEYIHFQPAGKKIKAGETYTIKISGKKKPTLGPNNIDWKIRFMEYEPNWAWWNSAWSKKAPIEVDSTSNLNNYQLKIDVNYDSDMNPDFSDLRFTNEEEDAELDYWIENKVDGSYAEVWVEIDSIDLGSGVQAYMYYRNPSASSTSDGDTTFELFDVSGIKAFWHMDEPSWSGVSLEVKDETGNFDGTGKYGANTIADGKFKRAGSFDGTNDYVDTGINGNSEYAINDDMTWSVWVKTTYTGDQYPIAVWDASNGIAYLQLNNGVIRARTSDKHGNGYHLMGETTYQDIDNGYWHHIIARIDVTNGDVKIDIDGVSQTVTLIRNEDVSGASYSKPWMIGKYSYLYFHGSIDELMFYNRILSASETSGIYNNYMEKMGSYYNIRKYADSEPTYSIGGEETVTTTTTLPTCSLGAECSSCVGWVTMDVNHYMCTSPYDTCVRDNNYNGKYDQICCTGTVQGITPL